MNDPRDEVRKHLEVLHTILPRFSEDPEARALTGAAVMHLLQACSNVAALIIEQHGWKYPPAVVDPIMVLAAHDFIPSETAESFGDARNDFGMDTEGDALTHVELKRRIATFVDHAEKLHAAARAQDAPHATER
jgi:hypothetical protein